MTDNLSSLELRSLATQGRIELSLQRIPVRAPAPDEVVVRIEAAPINPSDIGLLFGPADMTTLESMGTADNLVASAAIPPSRMAAVAARLDQSMPVGNEGAGVVVDAGADARALIGKTVAIFGGAMYTQYRVIKAAECMLLPAGTTAAEGAAAFVNPLTALGMVATMRAEGHKALVHTAAASNLGQMLNRICLKDGIPLVNIVRSAEQAAILREIGATHICDSSTPDFMGDLTDSLEQTQATIAFDAIGGKLPGYILRGMETVASRQAGSYSRYGSAVHKQVYVYGTLDTAPIEVVRNIGTAWGVGGWLLTPFLERIGPDGEKALRDRVAAELKTIFASRYTAEISLAEALRPDTIRAYTRRATGAKYLLNPQKT